MIRNNVDMFSLKHIKADENVSKVNVLSAYFVFVSVCHSLLLPVIEEQSRGGCAVPGSRRRTGG